MHAPRNRKTRIRIAVEALEPRRQFAAVLPTGYEQYAVELINRARANPTAETQRYAGSTDSEGNTYNGDLNEGLAAGKIAADPKQPLAINPYLTDSARKHSEWMNANSTFAHYENGVTPGDRMQAAGFPFDGPNAQGNWGENMAIKFNSANIDALSTVRDQQRNLFVDQTQSDRSHRINMMDPTRNEVGVGIAIGLYDYSGFGTVNSLAATHDSATQGKIYLTGVAYADTVSDDDFYTPGEGLGDIVIVAKRQGDGTQFTARTWASGGYSLELPVGTYDVTGTGTGLGTSVIAYSGVTVGTENVKRDFIPGTSPTGGTTAPAVGYVRVRSRTIIAYGTDGPDVIGILLDADTAQYVVGLNGVVTRYAQDAADSVAVLAAAGNDRVMINYGVAKSYVEGGAGKDTIYGGEGADTLYGNGGIDRILGNGGRDLLVGENGNDVVYGGPGHDTIYGGYGDDIVDGGGGNDRIYGGPGNDNLFGNRGRDYVFGNGGADTLNGGLHDDTIDTDENDTRIAAEVLI